MEMLNRATEEASDFNEFLRKMQSRQITAKGAPVIPKRAGESRKEYRARVRAETKMQAKV